MHAWDDTGLRAYVYENEDIWADAQPPQWPLPGLRSSGNHLEATLSAAHPPATGGSSPSPQPASRQGHDTELQKSTERQAQSAHRSDRDAIRAQLKI